MTESERRWRKHELVRTVRRIVFLLEKQYGVPRKRTTHDLLGLLIKTILSQHTNDQNCNRAYQGLRKRFPRWEDLLKARTPSMVEAIHSGGLAGQKAKHIKGILRWIKGREGRLTLSFLKKMSSEEIIKLMGGLKGIGPKTIHCLLLFGLGREVFPVDTHILRVGKRIGLIPGHVHAEQAHRWMAPLIPKGKSLSLHLHLIQLGRSVCKATRPQCEKCFLAEECLYHSQ